MLFFKKHGILVYLVLWSALFSYLALTKPKDNFDTIFYVASALAFEGAGPEQLHQKTYGLIQQVVKPDNYRDITIGSKPSNASYRSALFEHVDAFAQQLPFYQPRVLYNFIIFAGYKAGIHPVMVIRGVALFSALAGLFLLLYMVRSYTKSIWIPLMVPWLAAGWGLFDLARLSSPDALVFFAVCILFYGVARCPKRVITLLPLVVLIRADLIVLSVFVYGFLLRQRFCSRCILVSFAISVLMMQFVNSFYGHYGWYRTVYFTFVQQFPYPTQLPVEFDIRDYVNLWIQQFGTTIMTDDRFLVFVSMLVIYIWLLNKAKLTGQAIVEFILSSRIHSFCMVGVAYVAAHLVLFPASWERFFMAQYLILLVSVIVAMVCMRGYQNKNSYFDNDKKGNL